VKTVEEAAAKKLCPQVLHPLSYHSEAFRDWFYKWSERYVETYGADTLYYDVFGCRPKYREFNPNLNRFGDGTEGRLRVDFLKRVIANLRPSNPSVVPIMEGVIDTYAVYAPALVSHRRRFMQGYRYTFPDHILYEGNANGYWVPEKSLKALSYAFLDGNRFDLMLRWCNTNESERLVWLRDSLMPWVSNGTYGPGDKIKISDPEIEARIFDAGDTLGSQLITIRNISKKEGASLAINGDLQNNFGAFVIPLFGPIKKIPKNKKSIGIPDTVVSAILVITDPQKAPLLPLVYPEVTPKGLEYSLSLLNLSSKEKAFNVDMTIHTDPEKKLKVWSNTVKPGDIISHTFVPEPELFTDRVERLTFTVSSDAEKYQFRRTYDVIVEDPGFEWNDDHPRVLTKDKFRTGKSSLLLKPGSKARFPLKLAPNTTYEFKAYYLGEKEVKSYGILYNPRVKKTLGLIRKTPSKKNASPWKKLSGKIKTGQDGWLFMYLYNKGTAPVYYDDISISPIQ